MRNKRHDIIFVAALVVSMLALIAVAILGTIKIGEYCESRNGCQTFTSSTPIPYEDKSTFGLMLGGNIGLRLGDSPIGIDLSDGGLDIIVLPLE